MAQPGQAAYGQPTGKEAPVAVYPPPQQYQQYGNNNNNVAAAQQQQQPQYQQQQQPQQYTTGVVMATTIDSPPPPQLYAKDPEQYRTCGIVTSMVFTIVIFFGNLIGLGSNMIRFESDTSPDFTGGISHYDAKFVNGGTVILDLRIDNWESVPPLQQMASNYEWSSAMIILSLLLSVPLVILQICRLCRKLRHRKLWTILTGTLSIANVVLMLISYANIYTSTQSHLQDLNAWLLIHGGIAHVRAGGSSGFIAIIIFSYIFSIVLFAFGIRTCVGAKCNTGCCCEWCTCNLAEDSTFKGCRRTAGNEEDSPTQSGDRQADPEGNARTDRGDVYSSGAL